MTETLRVVVIGCGAAGLCMIKHLKTPSDDKSRSIIFETVGLEQSSAVGGTWIYSDTTGYDESGLPVHTSMYKNLRTNLPKEVMSFPDFPYSAALPSFLHHTDVLAYLEDYAQHFDLYKNIKFQTKVTLVEPCPERTNALNQIQWRVNYQKVLDSPSEQTKEISEIFDAVVVCNGHYSVPYMPKFSGQEKFQGMFLHSHDYRAPEDFEGKTVLCVGARSSGVDISIEVSSMANKVFLSHRGEPMIGELPNNLTQKPEIQELTANSVAFKNGETEQVDAIILCTGYKYDFPFLHENCNVKTTHNRVTPLYKHLVHIDFPNMIFLGICSKVTPFPQFHIQAAFSKAILTGELELPSSEEMRQDSDEDFAKRLEAGFSKHHAHVMGDKQWEYNNELADICNCPQLPKHVEDLYKYVWNKRKLFPMKYKSMDINSHTKFR